MMAKGFGWRDAALERTHSRSYRLSEAQVQALETETGPG